MNNKIYPLHQSLINSLRTTDAVLIAARLVRKLKDDLNLGHLEIEILVGLSSRNAPASFENVCDTVPHLSKDAVKRLLFFLHKEDHIYLITADDDHGFNYVITAGTANVIASVDKVTLSS